MVKNYIFLSIANLLILTAQTQVSQSYKRENFDVKKFQEKVIVIAAPAETIQLGNFRGITVIDARADTSVIGLMQKKVIVPFLGSLNNAVLNQTEQRINKKPTFIKLAAGLQNEAAQFANNSIAFSQNESSPFIVMVIKKLWLSDELNLDEAARDKMKSAAPPGYDIWASGIDLSIEFYLRDKANYYPLYRYDSIVSKPLTTYEYGPEFVALSLSLSLEKLQKMDSKVTGILNKRKFSFEDIRRHNEGEFNLPALKDSVLRKGVYMTFEEFKNNNPSQTAYEVRKDRLTDIIYIKQGKSEYVARHVWGYCNGKNAYIKSANNFFLLQRSANAFYIFGAKLPQRIEANEKSNAAYYYSGSRNPASEPVQYASSKTLVQLEPFQLDWRTGKLY